MSRHQFVLLLITLACQCPPVTGLFEWLRQVDAPPPPPAVATPPAVPPALLAKDAKFEMATVDEKFLAEAKHMELSPLDSCHHRVNMALTPHSGLFHYQSVFRV